MKQFEAILNAAITDEIIPLNPFKQIKPENKPAKHKAEICYLTSSEVKALENTPCYNPIIKQAFLFSCYSGLRYSDVCNLTWDKLQKGNDGNTFINWRCSQKYAISDKAEIDVKEGEIESLKMIEHLL
jgi:integrase